MEFYATNTEAYKFVDICPIITLVDAYEILLPSWGEGGAVAGDKYISRFIFLQICLKHIMWYIIIIIINYFHLIHVDYIE